MVTIAVGLRESSLATNRLLLVHDLLSHTSIKLSVFLFCASTVVFLTKNCRY